MPGTDRVVNKSPDGIIARLMEALSPGSYLVVNQSASDVHAEVAAEGARRLAESGSTPTTRRSRGAGEPHHGGAEAKIASPGSAQ
jgi:hypothetical protein